MEQNNYTATSSASRASFDAGLRAHFQKVYNVMAIGLVVTGLVAFMTYSTPALFQLINGTFLGLILSLAPLGFIFLGFTPARVKRLSSSQLNMLFYGFSAVLGLSLSCVFAAYSGVSIARVFFITSGMFLGTSIYGYTTKRDLSGMASFLIMGVIGLLIAMVVNIFLQSTMMQFVISAVGVLVYTGLIAFDTQNIKATYSAGYGQEANSKMATMSALSLYINFIMLFQFLLSLMGNRN